MSIFDFNRYKLYLKAYIHTKPSRGRGEVLKISKAVNVHSTFVSQVLHSNKDFSLEQSQLLTEYLELSDLETEYFLLLVQYERAGTQKLQKFFKSQLEKIKQVSLKISERVSQDKKLSESDKAQFYSDWIYSAIRLQTSIPNFQTVEDLSKEFSLPRAKTLEILEFLTRAGLCNKQTDLYSLGASRTHLEQNSPFIKQHHTNWRIKALQKASSLMSEELMFTAPMSISEKDFLKWRERLVDLIQDTFSMAKDSNAETLACLNIDWFRSK